MFISRSYPHSRLTTGFVTRLTRRVPLVELELLTRLGAPEFIPVFSGFRVARSLVLYVCFVDHFCSFVLFLLTIVLSVLLRYTDSDCAFGIFKLFLFFRYWDRYASFRYTLCVVFEFYSCCYLSSSSSFPMLAFLKQYLSIIIGQQLSFLTIFDSCQEFSIIIKCHINIVGTA